MYVISGIKITGGNVGKTTMGDGTRNVIAGNVLYNNSVIYLDGNNKDQINPTLFRCVSGVGSNDLDLYFNHTLITKQSCNGFVEAKGATKNRFPGVLNVQVCGSFNTDTEGVYTCTLNMINQSVGVYFSGRSKSLHNDQLQSFVKLIFIHSCSNNNYIIIIYFICYHWIFFNIILHLIRVSPRHIHLDKRWCSSNTVH